ncbi:mechanosensitive ion channel family protein [Phenylobacterium sp.]|uniref:mechanosensitive ion channel family protein n=1 Tax=Phenylobacterium sp. TaxID=1871053 RepID=UPI002E342BBA|nr:mechanosensitive ion channel domain-containing protein [Phenylobacterium sp.]HEX2561469.1 mechanosensitive ion channel domain-containing protein [Phenylobacterium sp.]
MPENLNDLDGLVLFAIGRTPVTLGGVVVGLLIIVGGFVAARLATIGLERVRGRSRHGKAALYIVEKLIAYGLVIVAFVAGLSTIGLNLSSLAVFAGAIGVGVGLGLQGIVKEFVSGLVLIFDRVMNVGDYVELEDGKRGLVQEIGPRAVRIRTNDNVDILVPNSKFIDGPVVNWTLHGQGRRIHIPFSVAYGSDRETVRQVVLEAARSVPFTLPEDETRKSQVWLVGFGDSGLQFELLVWPQLDAVKRPAAMHAAYTWAIAEALECAGIEVPFAQMDVRFRSLFGQEGEDALKALRLDRSDLHRETPHAPAPASTNDAADDLARPLPTPEPEERAEGR